MKAERDVIELFRDGKPLPEPDNTTEGLKILRAANERFRQIPWPAPFDQTSHALRQGDARDLSRLPDNSIHLVVTSPPYWTLKEYPDVEGQLGAVETYETFLDQLDKAWAECARVLVPGGRICCVVGDVCVPRRRFGKHFVMPLHADIQVRARAIELDALTPILWYKIANGITEAQGNGAGFYGKPYQPGAIVKNDIEYILFLRKGAHYRTPNTLQKALSMLTKVEMQGWWRSVWTDIRGASTRAGHPRALSCRAGRTTHPHVFVRRRCRSGPVRRHRYDLGRRGFIRSAFGRRGNRPRIRPDGPIQHPESHLAPPPYRRH